MTDRTDERQLVTAMLAGVCAVVALGPLLSVRGEEGVVEA